MIITCPDCATSYEHPDEVIDEEGKLVQCEECRFIWTHKEPQASDLAQEELADYVPSPETGSSAGFYLEDTEDGPLLDYPAAERPAEDFGAQPVETLEFEEVADAQPGTALTVIETPEAAEAQLETINVKSEAARLAQAAASAKLEYQRRRQRRIKSIRGWGALAASVVLLSAPAVAFPKQVTVLFPAAAQLYAKAGVQVNLSGLEFKEISYKRVLDQGALVLEIEGKVVNVSQTAQDLAPVHISLLDDQQQSLYSWTLKAEPATVAPEGAATFKTRLAAPPSDATNLRVRFALPSETQ